MPGNASARTAPAVANPGLQGPADPATAIVITAQAGNAKPFKRPTRSAYWAQETGVLVSVHSRVVPEPGALSVLNFAGLGLALRRRSRQ